MKNVLLSYLLFSVIACQSQTISNNNLQPDEFEKGIKAEAVQILDVRTAAEFKSGNIKNALQADWTNKKEFNERIIYVDKNKPVYIYCLVGGRSAAAAAWMRENGFTHVVNLDGGINAWKAAKKPLEGSSNEKQLTLNEYLASIPIDKTVLVDFGASWCPPCVKMAPVIDELQKKEELDFLFIKIDAGIHTDLMKALGIKPIPVFIVYKNGKETWRKEGVVSMEELTGQLE
jgi:rhodanese-related sulfurtransferase